MATELAANTPAPPGLGPELALADALCGALDYARGRAEDYGGADGDDAADRCINCRADLEPVDDQCPECGTWN